MMESSLFKKAFLLVALSLTTGLIGAQTPKALEVKELKLSNGMNIWLNEDHSQPKVFGAVVVNAGGKDCPNTGIAHYFEHIMFKGTEEIGTVDYEKEKPWLDSIAGCYDRLAATSDAMQRAAIQKEINRLSQKAGEYAIPNEFNSLISQYGGSQLNAGTSYDFTFYHNVFTPQYLEHWCWLNSDRLINPVFRMFQGELETVYEEKNRSDDNILEGAREKIMKELFGTQPYAYPIIGSTENLKNPQLSEMKKFYDKYYVGCNMGLVLCGDFDASQVMPLLERTFGRIPQGTMPTRVVSTLPDIQERTVEAKVQIPLVNVEVLTFKGPTDFEKDANALKVASYLLSNGKAGMLDSLMNEGALLAAVATSLSLNDAGVAVLLVVPNLLAKTAKAEAACLAQVRRVIDGDFSEEQVAFIKQELSREANSELETIDERAMQMVTVMASGHRWQDYLDQVDAISHITKADVIAAAKRYYDAPFVRFKKKYGHSPKDKISQPGYTPVKPKNRNEESVYAKRMAAIPVNDADPRLIDFDRDATTLPLGGQATLYTVKNPVNDLFSLTVSYNRGEKADPRMNAVVSLLNNIGTDSLTKQQLGMALQRYGAEMSFSSNSRTTSMTVTGVDKHFLSTMALVGHFIHHLKSNEKALKNVKDALKAEEKGLDEDNTDVLSALSQKIMYGDNSRMLHRMTYKEAKQLTGEQLIDAFKDIWSAHCTVVYSGTLDSREVADAIRKNLPVERSQSPYKDYADDVIGYDQPVVYVYDMPKSRQTLLLTYDQLPPLSTQEARVPAILLDQYFGSGMSSVLFQEVREFRSMAYSTGSSLMSRSYKKNPNSPLGFITMTGTQGDKAMGAITLIDSLFSDMPCVEKNFNSCRQEIINDLSNDFPSFRGIGSAIASQKIQGFSSDKNTGLAALYRNASFEDVKKFYETHLKHHASHRVLGIVGSKKKLNIKELEKYGKVVFLKEKDLFRK